MPIAAVKLIPGVDVEKTQTLNEAGVSACNLIRYRQGLIQKVGGWTKFYPSALSSAPRALWAWSDLNAVNHLAVGTNVQLAVVTAGSLQDITPQETISNITLPALSTTINTTTVGITDPGVSNLTTFDSVQFDTPVSIGGIILTGLYPIALSTGTNSYNITSSTAATSTVPSGGVVPVFNTTLNSATVEVTLPAHGLSTGQTFTFPISTTGNGVTILGSYVITSIPDANNFDIAVVNQASSTGSFSMNGGQLQLTYLISIGPTIAGTGYGIGGYGLGGYGTGITSGQTSGTPITTTDWTFDNWGEDLIANPRGGPIYFWDPTGGYQTASVISTGPAASNGIFIAMPEQILVSWGTSGSVQGQALGINQALDPLLVRWSDILNFNAWIPLATNQAGSFRIPRGSVIRGGIQGPQQALIWTDVDLWAMNYLGFPLTFGFQLLGSGCGAVGAHSMAVLRGSVFWMGLDSFYTFTGGGVAPIPCSVWDQVFQNLDTANISKVRASANSSFSEVAWFYPSLGGNGENDSYVKVNITENFAWDYGTLSRSAWIDQSVFGQPIGASPQGVIYQHETTNDADGQPMNSFFQTGAFMLAEGNNMAFVDWLFPDFKYGTVGGTQGANINITLLSQSYPSDTPVPSGPFTVNSTTPYITPRLRGRQMAMLVGSSDIGSFWRLGNARFRVAPDGQR